jgi:hypothetical protein
MITYGNMPLRAAERPINWPTVPALIAALIDAQARILKEAFKWAR